MTKRLIPFVLLFILALLPVLADEHQEDAAAQGKTPAPFEEKLSVTRHTLSVDGEEVAYTATAGTILLKNETGETLASVFSIAYTRDGIDDPATRPVTFSFNGGPGAAAVWVNLGAFGPKKVLADDEGMPLPPPGKLVDNPYSVLDVTDLVFIDPVGTGLSRVADGVDRMEFHGLKADIRSVGEFIRLWVSRNGRWASPKFLAGESYGTARAAGLADHLQQEHGMYLNGIISISTVLAWQHMRFHPGNDLAYLVFLPMFTATAWYHGKLPADLQELPLRDVLDEAEHFALNDYALALLQGDNLDGEKRRSIAQRVGRYAGLDPGYVERSNLRVSLWRFQKELLRDEGLTVGRLDSRFTGYDRDTIGEVAEYDASNVAVDIGYITLMNDYIRRELGFETDLRYRSLAEEVWPWTWDSDNTYAYVAEDLRRAMVRNRDLKVLFASGYYDGATPYFDTDYTVSHLGLPEELRDNIMIRYYEAGHMMYIRRVDHEKFKRDVVELIEKALRPRG